MLPYAKTMEMIKQVDLGHPAEQVSAHGISSLGYLKFVMNPEVPTARLLDEDGPVLEFVKWPAEADGKAIFAQYMGETVTNSEEKIGDDSRVTASRIKDLIEACAKTSREHGFHERGAALLEEVDEARDVFLALKPNEEVPTIVMDRFNDAVSSVQEYVGNRLMLVVSELVEAHDDIRSGNVLGDAWFTENGKIVPLPFHPVTKAPRKPEGPLSEIIDALVRLFDLLGEFNLADAGSEMFVLKTNYNETRPYKHGRAF